MTLDELLDQAKKANEEEKIKALEARKKRFEEILERRRKLRYGSDDDSGVESSRLERPYEEPEEPDQEYDDYEYYDDDREEWIWDIDGRNDDEWER